MEEETAIKEEKQMAFTEDILRKPTNTVNYNQLSE